MAFMFLRCKEMQQQPMFLRSKEMQQQLVRTCAIVWREWVVIPLGLPGGLCFVVLLITKLQEKQALVDLVVAAAKLLIAIEAESEAPTLFHLGRRQPLDLAAFDDQSLLVALAKRVWTRPVP